MQKHDHVLLMLPPLLHTWVKGQAEQNKTSLNTQLNFILETYKIQQEMKNAGRNHKK